MQHTAIAHIANSLDPGGAEKLVVQMASALASDYQVMVVCLDEPGSWAEALRRRGIEVVCLHRQAGFDASLPGRLAALWRRRDVRLLHAHQCTAWFYCALSRLLYRRPRLLFEEHGRFHPERRNRMREMVNRYLIRHLTDEIVAVSDDIRRRLVQFEGLDWEDVAVIQNGVEPARRLPQQVRSSMRARLGIAADDFLVGWVGRLDPVKNLAMLIEAMVRAAHVCGNIRLLLVGAGPCAPALEAQARALGILDRIVFAGFRTDARELTQAMDLFVLPSLSEGTSMALLDAMAAGVPVAVSRVGGNPEIIDPAKNGWMFESGDVVGLAEILVSASTDVSRTLRLASEAVQTIARHFSFEVMMQAYGGHYYRLLKQGRGGGA